MNMIFMKPQEEPHTLKEQKLSIDNLLCKDTSRLKKKKEYITESLNEVNRITPAGPTPHRAAEGSEAIHRTQV